MTKQFRTDPVGIKIIRAPLGYIPIDMTEFKPPLPLLIPSTFAVVQDNRTIDYWERERLFDEMERKLRAIKKDYYAMQQMGGA